MVESTESGRTGSAGGSDSTNPAAEPVRSELADLLARRSLLADDARADAVAARHAQGRRTAGENLDRLLDLKDGATDLVLAAAIMVECMP